MKLWRYGQSVEYLGRRYRLDGMLGSGGMADVCLAWDEREKREVAVKILKSDDLDQETLNRFMKEAAQIVRWQHPHILRVFESLQVELIDAASGAVLFYMVSEYARGGDLHKRLTQGQPFPLSATFALFRQLCDAVQYAHEHGVIHRDLKPLNMLFRRPESGPEEVVLSDFGLAVQTDASHHTFAHGGTLAYMAPEQFQGHALPASDIFALGVILYLLCTGGLPFRRSLQDIPRVVQGQAPLPTRPSLLNAELPPALDAVILRAMHDLPTERYHQPCEFWEAIALALTTNARTFLFSDSLGQNAGQTWPYDGSEQPQRSRQAGQHELPPVAPGSLPSEGMAEVEEGPVSALWIAREKQKASPVRLSLPTNSILMSPNVDEADERPSSAGGASSTWQADDDHPRATPSHRAEQAPAMETRQNTPESQRRALQRRPSDSRPTRVPDQPRRGAGSARAPGSHDALPFVTLPPSDISSASAQTDNHAPPAASAPGSTSLPASQRSRRDPAQTSRRQPFSEEPGHQTNPQADTSFDDESERQSSTRRASRQPASNPARSRSQHVSEYNSYGAYEMSEDENDPTSSARQPGVPGRRSTARRQSQETQTSARGAPASRPVPRRQARNPWQAAHLPTGARSGKRRGLLLTILGGLALLGLLFALFAATSFQGTILTFFGAPITRVTIQPRSQLLQEDVTRAIVISGQPAPGQIPGRQLTATSTTQTATANATGSIPAKRATGQLTFINNTSFNITIQSTIISDKNGVQITFTVEPP